MPGREGSESVEEWAISVLNGGCVGDEASLYRGRRRSSFTGQAQHCRALVSGHGGGSLPGKASNGEEPADDDRKDTGCETRRASTTKHGARMIFGAKLDGLATRSMEVEEKERLKRSMTLNPETYDRQLQRDAELDGRREKHVLRKKQHDKKFCAMPEKKPRDWSQRSDVDSGLHGGCGRGRSAHDAFLRGRGSV